MPKRVFDILTPYKDVLIFILALFVSNYVWKLTVAGDESGVGTVSWLGWDVTAGFAAYASHITDCVYAICSLFSDQLSRFGDTTLSWSSGNGTRIVWSCTPIKQSFIWLCLMLTTPGWRRPTEREVWRAFGYRFAWIGLGWAVIYAFNILRITLITLLIAHHPEWFELFHTYIFKYLFYFIIFLLWVGYVEKIREK